MTVVLLSLYATTVPFPQMGRTYLVLVIMIKIHHILDPFLPDIEHGIFDFRRALWITAGSVWRWRFVSEDACGFVNSVANHRSFSIPEYITKVDAIAHLLKVFIRVLSLLGWQPRFRSFPVGPELS